MRVHGHERKTLDDYRGLIHKTAARNVVYLDDEYDDIVQALSIKVWRAIESYNPGRDRGKGIDSYVFACMTCAVIDLHRKRRRPESFIEDLAPARASEVGPGIFGSEAHDHFLLRYGLAETDAYREVEDERPELPATLTPFEAQVVLLLAEGYKQVEIRSMMGLPADSREVEKAVKAARLKMADWRPASRPTDDPAPISRLPSRASTPSALPAAAAGRCLAA